MTSLKLDDIHIDGGTQLRAAVSKATVSEYATAITDGAEFPPIVVFAADDGEYWLADGFHRFDAHREAGRSEIEADIRAGSRRDAILHAAGANAEHGLRRTSEDKRQAIMALLHDAEWRKWSDREIAKATRTDHKTVGKLRRELNGEIPTNPLDGDFPIETERRFISRHGTEATRRVASTEDDGRLSMLATALRKMPTDALAAELRRRGADPLKEISLHDIFEEMLRRNKKMPGYFRGLEAYLKEIQ
jgi:ParB-like chromosome segregation protein Spo0J